MQPCPAALLAGKALERFCPIRQLAACQGKKRQSRLPSDGSAHFSETAEAAGVYPKPYPRPYPTQQLQGPCGPCTSYPC